MSTGTLLAGVAILAAIAVICVDRLRLRAVIGRMSSMLDRVMEGGFQEETFDESALSALEAKLVRVLTVSSISGQRVTKERDKIKTLISDISHQTKTPVSNILLYAQLLKEQELTEDGRTAVAALSNQAQKLHFLVYSLVKLSRLETGVIAVQPQYQPLQPLLEEAAEQISPKAARKGLAFILEETEACAVFDRKWTGEALFNLLDNAVKYTASGTIRLSATANELFCQVDISDTGTGIPEEEQSKVFQRFYRAQSVLDQEGVGIGLFLAREIVAAEGGYLKVKSRPGQGSTFSVFLPRPEA